MIQVVLNFVIFQAAWFITVYSAASGLPIYGPLFTSLWMLFHLKFFTKKYRSEISLLLFAATLGYLLDSLMVLIGAIAFPERTALGGPSPLWMVALWINLAATINFSLKWLHGRLLLAALLGAIAGPAAYYAGSVLGAIELFGIKSLLAISVQWLLAMPLLIWFAGYEPGQRLIHSLFAERGGE